MKLKKVAQICCQTGMFALYDKQNEDGETVAQWLGDGYAIYPITGLPYMEEENICAMFDISEKKQEKLVFRHSAAPGGIDLEDISPVELPLEDPKLCVRYEGKTLLPLRTSAGITLVQEKYLAPLDSLDYMQLFERRGPGVGVYIVAKVGMLIQAVIMPFDAVTEDFVDKLDKLTAQCRSAMEVKERERVRRAELAEAEEPGQETLYQVDKSTGEVVVEGAGENG